MTRLLLSHLLRGSRAYLYELLDDPERDSYESNWGLVKCPSHDPKTWTPKPAYYSVARLLACAADPGPWFRPRPVALQVEAPAGVNTLVMGKRDGSTTLYLWRDVDLWSASAKRAITVNVTMTDSAGPRTLSVAGEVVTRRIHR